MVAIRGNHFCTGSGNSVSEHDVEKKENKSGKRYTHKWFIQCGVCGRRVGVHQSRARYLRVADHGDVAVSDQAYNDAHQILVHLREGPIGNPDGVVAPICTILGKIEPMGDFRNKAENYVEYWEMAGLVSIEPLDRHVEADKMRYRDELRYNAFKRAIKQVARFLRINIDFDASTNQWCVLNGDQEVLLAFLRAVSDLQDDMDGYHGRFLAQPKASQRTWLSWQDLRRGIEDDAVQEIIRKHERKLDDAEKLRQLRQLVNA
jgi:hypothetical protein